MSDLKTQRTRASVAAFLNKIEDPDKRRDAKAVHKIMREESGDKGAMWGSSIVGYGSCSYTYKDGRKIDWMLAGFSPRKQALSLYIMSGLKNNKTLLNKLGKYKSSKACLYVKQLDDIDLGVLRKLIAASIKAKRD